MAGVHGRRRPIVHRSESGDGRGVSSGAGRERLHSRRRAAARATKMASLQAVAARNTITLKGAAKTVCEFFAYAVNR